MISAINSTEAELVFSKEVKEAKQANFKAMDKDGAVVVIAGAKVDAKDKKKVVLTFAEKFKDKMEYTVESEGVVDVDDKAMAKDSDKFTYEAAEVKSVEFTSTVLGMGKDLIDYVKVTDALGRDVTKEVAVSFDSSDHTIVDPVSQKTSATKEGNAEVVARVKVGADWVKSPKTIVKVTKSAATTFAGYYLATSPVGTTAEFEKLEEKTDYVNIEKPMTLGVYFKDQFGESVSIAQANDLEIDAQTPNIAVIDKTTLLVTGVTEGDAYFKVKHKTAKTENLLRVTVKGVPKAGSIELKEKVFSMSTKAPLNLKTINLTYKDQFNNPLDSTGATLEAKSSDPAVVQANATDEKTLRLTAVKKGMATVTLTFKKGAVTLKETIEVTAKEPGDMAGYKAVASESKLDVAGKAPLRKTATVNVYKVDADGVYIEEVTLGGTKKLVAVDANGVEDSSIVKVSGSTVTAVAEGTGYVKVILDTITLDEKLTFDVVHTGQTVTKVGLKSKNYMIADKDISTTQKYTKAMIEADLKKLLQFKDQKGRDMADALITGTVEIKYTVAKHTLDSIEFSGDDIVKLKDVKSATADIVIEEVKYDGEELTPENELRVLLTVTDNNKLQVVKNDDDAAISGAYQALTPKIVRDDGLGTDFDGTKVANAEDSSVKLEKKNASGVFELYNTTAYTWGAGAAGAALPTTDDGEYKLTLMDFSGNVTEVFYTIDTTAPKVKSTKVNKKGTHWGQTEGDNVVITFNEPIKPDSMGIAGITKNGDTSAELTDILNNVFKNDKIGVFDTTQPAGTDIATVGVTVSLDSTGKVVTITVKTKKDNLSTSPEGELNPAANIKDLLGN